MAAPASQAELYGQFAVFNTIFFGGRLPFPVICWRYTKKYYGMWQDQSAKYPNGRIVLSSAEQPECGWHGVLLHEMIHAQIGLEEDEHDDAQVEYHGPLFAAWCNAIGTQLGIPHVSVEDCWAWPWACHFAELEPAA